MEIIWKNSVGNVYYNQKVRDAVDAKETLIKELSDGGNMSTFGEPGDTICIVE